MLIKDLTDEQLQRIVSEAKRVFLDVPYLGYMQVMKKDINDRFLKNFKVKCEENNELDWLIENKFIWNEDNDLFIL